MVTRLVLDTNVISIWRTHQQLEVQATTQAVLERLAGDSTFAPLLDNYLYATRHHYGSRFEPLDWQTVLLTLLADLVGEPRASIILKGSYLGAKVDLHLNCENEIVKEKVDGKRRSVPKASDTSQASVDAGAKNFTDPAFTQAYLHLLGDLFELIGGEYGYAEHVAIQHGTDFDRVHQSFFEPWFIAWANLFGPQLVARLGRERLLNAPAYEVRELPAGGIVLAAAASPLQQLEPEVQERIARIKAHLGILSPGERAAPEKLAAFETSSTTAEAEMKRRIEEAFCQSREKTAAEMKRQAEGCVEGIRRAWGKRLDFSPQSLAIADELIRTGFEAGTDDETVATAVQALGAYTGEVVRRTLGGVWHDEEMNGRPILLNVGKHSARVEPFRVIAERFRQRHEEGSDLIIWYGQIG